MTLKNWAQVPIQHDYSSVRGEETKKQCCYLGLVQIKAGLAEGKGR